MIFSIADDAGVSLANLLWEAFDAVQISRPVPKCRRLIGESTIVSFTPVNVAEHNSLDSPAFFVYADFWYLLSFIETLDFACSISEVALYFMFVKSVDHFVFISRNL